MTRIGRYQIKVPDNFTGNASYRRDNLAPLKISRPNCVDQYQSANVAWLPYWSAYPNGTSSTRLFLKSPPRLTTRLRKCSLARSTRLLIYWRLRYGDPDAITNAFGCDLSSKYASI